MLIGLVMEYIECLENFSTKIVKVDENLPNLLQAITRVSDEESARLSDKAYRDFSKELDIELSLEVMPLSSIKLESIFTTLQRKYRSQLRTNLAELLSFDQVLEESDRFN
jgi:hypothetical protein